jgi:hypothetical protein
MSNLQSKMAAVRFEPVGKQPSPPPVSEWMIVMGVAYPAVIIALELVSHMCAQAFFDPVPTYAHAVAVFSVPAANLLVWKHLWDGSLRKPKWLAFANGIALAIGGFYALLFLPLAPLALLGLPVLVGVLPLAPLVAFWAAVKLSQALLAPARHSGSVAVTRRRDCGRRAVPAGAGYSGDAEPARRTVGDKRGAGRP